MKWALWTRICLIHQEHHLTPYFPKPYISGGTILLKTRQQLLMNMVGVIIPETGMKNFTQGMAVRGVFTLD